MFAVPGWNLSAKVQAQEKSTDSTSAAQANHSLKKRKRSHNNEADYARKIEGAELERLWNDRFGDKKKRRKEKKPKKGQDDADPRKPHLLSNATDSAALAKSVEPQDSSKGSKQDRQQSKKDKKKSRDTTPPNQNPKTKPTTTTNPLHDPPAPAPTNLTPLQQKMHSKLTSARFRHLNQTLYTTPSSAALELFKTTPSLFTEYHLGFTQQVQSSWPVNPIEIFANTILNRAGLQHATHSKSKKPRKADPSAPNTTTNATTTTTTTATATANANANTDADTDKDPLPRRTTSSCTLADLGCGDAILIRTLLRHPGFKKANIRIHSFDLHAANNHITVSDIAHLPLRDGEADIAIFCLSLMGTNWIDFIEEAWRILRGDGKGEMWVAEVKSRFARKGEGGSVKGRGGNGEVLEHSVGKKRKPKKKPQDEGEDEVAEDLMVTNEAVDDDTTDLSPFISVLQRRGFTIVPASIDKSNKMFVSMKFVKSGVPSAGKYKGWKWNGKEYAKQHDGNMKFTGSDDGDEVSREVEGKALKPCVYKLR